MSVWSPSQFNNITFKRNPVFNRLYVSKCGKVARLKDAFMDPRKTARLLTNNSSSPILDKVMLHRADEVNKEERVFVSFKYAEGPRDTRANYRIQVRRLVASTWFEFSDVIKLGLGSIQGHMRLPSTEYVLTGGPTFEQLKIVPTAELEGNAGQQPNKRPRVGTQK